MKPSFAVGCAFCAHAGYGVPAVVCLASARTSWVWVALCADHRDGWRIRQYTAIGV